MDIRIVNREGDMFATGSRTLKVIRDEICLYDANSQSIETIERMESEGSARSTKKWIIEKIIEKSNYESDNIIIKL